MIDSLYKLSLAGIVTFGCAIIGVYGHYVWEPAILLIVPALLWAAIFVLFVAIITPVAWVYFHVVE